MCGAKRGVKSEIECGGFEKHFAGWETGTGELGQCVHILTHAKLKLTYVNLSTPIAFRIFFQHILLCLLISLISHHPAAPSHSPHTAKPINSAKDAHLSVQQQQQLSEGNFETIPENKEKLRKFCQTTVNHAQSAEKQ